MSKQKEEEDKQHPLVLVENFFYKWSDFSVGFAASPGPLYTAGANAVADSIRKEAEEMLEVVKALHEEIEWYEEQMNEACWRC